MPGPDDIATDLTHRIRGLAPGVIPSASDAPGSRSHPDDASELRTLFRAQATSRYVDLAARRMQSAGRGYYTIASAGHESNAAVAAMLRPSDPALLHYRSGAFYIRRAWQFNEGQAPDDRIDPVADILAGVAADSSEPIAGGRHKVIGRRELAVIPQTSTVASHLPRAIGTAFAIERSAKLGLPTQWPTDAITVASLGDASLNHSTAVGAMGAALFSHHAGLPMPLLVVCEDNGLGISVRTPAGWVEANYANRPGLQYFSADGADPLGCLQVASEAANYVRTRRAPAFLHLRTVRLYGHAGSDVEAGYRSAAEIAADAARDPLLATACQLVAHGLATATELAAGFREIGSRTVELAETAMTSLPLRTRAEVMAPIALRRPDAVRENATRGTSADDTGATPLPGVTHTREYRPGRAPAAIAGAGDNAGAPHHTDTAGADASSAERLTVAQAINRTLAEEMARRPEMLVFGEDVARKGGVYGVTRGLQKRFGTGRVFDTPLDEQTILGLALGTGLAGLLPVPEIQYLAYLHNAADQLRGEAATLPFFSQGQYRNPMVVRIAAYAYQKGFGGHFHNDNSVAALRDIPGLVIASPSRGDDASAMLRTCLAAAHVDGSVSAFLEPIALYHTRNLYDDGDNGWLAPYPGAGEHVPIGSARTYGDGKDLTIITFGNGVPISLRVAEHLAHDGVRCRVVDLRWLSPLPVGDILRESAATGRVLVVDETRHTGGIGEGIVTALVEGGFTGRIGRVASADSFVPLGPAANLVLVGEDDVRGAARALLD